MKKLLVLAGISVLLFFSCSTTVGKGMVFDDSVPIEKSSQIVTYAGKITGYNGISLTWKPTLSNAVQIPAGDTIFEFDIVSPLGNTIYKGSGALFQYKYLPNKKYFLWFNVRDDIWGMNVYTFEIGDKIPATTMRGLEPYLTAFVPFINNKQRQKTVLE